MRTRNHPAAQLVESSGPNVGRVHDLSLGEHVIGRGGAADVVLDHKDVSRPHARIDVGVDGVMVCDLDSKNGVFIDGQAISEPVRLSHGQRFSLGELMLTVSHPGSQVSRALAQAGETTVTVSRPRPEPTGERASLILPLFGVALFGALVVAMLLL